MSEQTPSKKTSTKAKTPSKKTSPSKVETPIKEVIKKPTGKYFYGVGRRKASTTRAKIYPDSPFQITVDGQSIESYFPQYYRLVIENMLTKVGYKQGAIELFARGGGIMAQAESSRLAIAKALIKIDEGFRPVLRMYGYLTTDIRKVLPKRAGHRKARKREQWSKR